MEKMVTRAQEIATSASNTDPRHHIPNGYGSSGISRCLSSAAHYAGEYY
jgi:hypothetical protein